MNFFARHKKLFLILGFLALVALMAFMLYRLFFKTGTFTPEPTPGTEVGGQLPQSGLGGNDQGNYTGPGGLPQNGGSSTSSASGFTPGSQETSEVATGGLTRTKVVNQSPTLGATIDSSGKVSFYDKTDGRFYRLGADGKRIALSDKVFYSVQNVTWAPDSDKAILEYPDGSKIMYNFALKKQVTLPSHWKDFSFSPESDKIIAKSIGLDQDNRWLVVANADGSQAKAIEEIGLYENNVYADWSPTGQIAAMYTEGLDFDRQEVYFVGLNGENFKSTVIEGRGFQEKWSKEGDKLLYSVYHSRDELKPRLWLVNAQGDNIGQGRQSLDLMTWANKCTFASNTEVYCAVPENLQKGAGLFPELADQTKDDLYKIDLTTGSQKLIAVPDGSYNISDIMVGSSQDYLYFTDKFSGSIYQVRLR